MPAGKSRDLTIAAVAVGLVAVLSLAGAIMTPLQADAGRASTFSAANDGAKAAYLTMAALGYGVERSLDPIGALQIAPERTTLILASPQERASDQDRRAMRRFVAAGGVVLATGCGGASFLAAAGGGTDAPFATVQRYRPVHAGALSNGAPEIALAPQCADMKLGPGYGSVYGDGAGVVRSASIGRGTAVWWAGDTPLTNGAIADRRNLELLLNAVGRGRRSVVWDEYYHGLRRSLWSYAARTPLPWAAAQLLIVGAAIAMGVSRRRAPIRPRAIEPRTAPMEFVDTMAALYGRTGAGPAAVRTAYQRARRLLLVTAGLPVSTSDERLARRLTARTHRSAAEIADVLATARRAADGETVSEGEALAIVRRVQDLVAAARPSDAP